MKWPNGLSWNGYGPWEWIAQGTWGPSLMQLGLGFQPGPYPSSWTGPNSNSITCLDWAPTQAQIKSKPKNTKFPHSPPLQPPPGHHHQNPLCPWAHRQPHRRLHRSPTSHHPLSRSAANAHSRVPALVAEAKGRTGLGQPRWCQCVGIDSVLRLDEGDEPSDWGWVEKWRMWSFPLVRDGFVIRQRVSRRSGALLSAAIRLVAMEIDGEVTPSLWDEQWRRRSSNAAIDSADWASLRRWVWRVAAMHDYAWPCENERDGCNGQGKWVWISLERDDMHGLLERNMMDEHGVYYGWEGRDDHAHRAPCTWEDRESKGHEGMVQ